MTEKVTIMVLKVDLQCNKCYKKVKKVLSKFPGEIQDQTYDEKQNTVTIKVVSCCPEKLRDKICYKGGGSIKSIEIKSPPKEPEKKKEPEKAKDPEKKKEPQKSKEPEKKKEPEKSEKPADKPKVTFVDPPKSPPKPPVPVPIPVAVPVPGYPPNYPFVVCCPECYGGHVGGPCYHVGGPILCYDGYYGRPVYDSWGGGGGGCSIM